MGKKGLIFIAVIAIVVIGMGVALMSAKDDRSLKAKTEEKIQLTTEEVLTFLGMTDEMSEYEEKSYTEALKTEGEANAEIHKLVDELPDGSSMPVCYVGVDAPKVIFIYQEIDGTYVMKQSKFEGDQWVRKEEKVAPKPATSEN